MNISDKMGMYLLEKMERDLESNKIQLQVKEEVIEKKATYNTKLVELIEEWECKYFKLEEECCELKKKNKTLENKLEVATAMVGIKSEECIPPKRMSRKKGVVAND